MFGRRLSFVLVALPLLPLLCVPAQAQLITAFWQRVTITPQAIANDPALANMQSWDLMVTTTGDWVGAALAAALTKENLFYKHPMGGFTQPDPKLIGFAPALEFSTYVSSPTDDGTNQATVVIGGFPQSNQAHLGDLNGRFSMFWSDLVVDPPGTHQIARLTFPSGSIAQVLHPEGFSSTSQSTPDASTIIPQIPEPGIIGSLVAGTLFAARTRKHLVLKDRAKRSA